MTSRVQPRTCSHCGVEFLAVDREDLCKRCRKPAFSRKARPGDPLTPREKQVVELILAGLSNQEIGDALLLTMGTIKEFNHRIFIKMNVGSRAELQAQKLRAVEQELARHIHLEVA